MLTHPLLNSVMSRLSASLDAARALDSETMPSSAIRSMTTLRRASASSGSSVGLNRVGFCTSPASVADWAMVSLAGLTEK